MIRTNSISFVAVTYNGKDAIPFFEKATNFMVYFYNKGERRSSQLLSLYPRDDRDLAAQLKDSMISSVICRNIGPRALHSLREAGLTVYTFEGGAGAAIESYESGLLRAL